MAATPSEPICSWCTMMEAYFVLSARETGMQANTGKNKQTKTIQKWISNWTLIMILKSRSNLGIIFVNLHVPSTKKLTGSMKTSPFLSYLTPKETHIWIGCERWGQGLVLSKVWADNWVNEQIRLWRQRLLQTSEWSMPVTLKAPRHQAHLSNPGPWDPCRGGPWARSWEADTQKSWTHHCKEP